MEGDWNSWVSGSLASTGRIERGVPIDTALEVDQEGYIEAAKEARGNNSREDVATFTEAGERITALMAKLRPLVE